MNPIETMAKAINGELSRPLPEEVARICARAALSALLPEAGRESAAQALKEYAYDADVDLTSLIYCRPAIDAVAPLLKGDSNAS